MLKTKSSTILAMAAVLAAARTGAEDAFLLSTQWRLVEEQPVRLPDTTEPMPMVTIPAGETAAKKMQLLEHRGLKLDFLAYPAGLVPRMPTTAHLGFDDNGIHVLISGTQAPDYKLRAIRHEPVTAKIWDDDNFEIFIDPFVSRNEYVQFIVNPLGQYYDARCFIQMVPDPAAADMGEMISQLSSDADFASGATTEVECRPALWRVLLSVPFSAFGLEGPPVGQAWGFNFCHTNRNIGELSQWRITTGRHGFHTPGQFGALSFGDRPPPVQCELLLPLAGHGANRLAINLENPGAARDIELIIALADASGKTVLREEHRVSAAAGHSAGEVMFDLPFELSEKHSVSVFARTAQGDMLGSLVRSLVLTGPFECSMPLTQIYTSDREIRGVARLHLGENTLSTASIEFTIIRDREPIRTHVIDELQGNILSFGINPHGLMPGKHLLRARLLDGERQVAAQDIAFDVIAAPFPF